MEGRAEVEGGLPTQRICSICEGVYMHMGGAPAAVQRSWVLYRPTVKQFDCTYHQGTQLRNGWGWGWGRLAPTIDVVQFQLVLAVQKHKADHAPGSHQTLHACSSHSPTPKPAWKHTHTPPTELATSTRRMFGGPPSLGRGGNAAPESGLMMANNDDCLMNWYEPLLSGSLR